MITVAFRTIHLDSLAGTEPISIAR